MILSGALDYRNSSGQALDPASIGNRTDWHRLSAGWWIWRQETNSEQRLDSEVVILKQGGTESR